jgi:hypothetical protein
MVLLDFCPDFRKIAHEPPVIRASGARCDITRLVPAAGAGACCSCKEARVQKATVLQRSLNGAEGADRLRHLVLVRIACALRGATKAEIATDLAPIATGLHAAQWRAKVDRELDALGAQGLVTAKSARLDVSDAGKAQAVRFLGVKGDFPRVWSALRDIRLVAVALGMQREPAKRLKALDTVDGLRGAIVESAYNLKIKGVATPARLREALAAMALKRAFGDKGTAGLAGKLGLSAKASRTLAAQLSRELRDFGTDTRLIAALAAEHLDTAASDIGGLRVAVLRRYFGAASPKLLRRLPPWQLNLLRPLLRRLPFPWPLMGRCRWAAPICPVLPLRCGGMQLARHADGAGTARPTSATCGGIFARSAPTGVSRRSSSSACSPKRIAPASSRSPTPT